MMWITFTEHTTLNTCWIVFGFFHITLINICGIIYFWLNAIPCDGLCRLKNCMSICETKFINKENEKKNQP